MKKGPRVFLVEKMPTVANLGSCIIMPRSGLMTMAAILGERTDYEIHLLFEPYCGRVEPQRIAAAEPRFVLLNGLTTTAVENEILVRELRRLARRPLEVIVGGEHATMFPHATQRYADVIIPYEGDEALVKVLAALELGEASGRDRALAAIPGLWYRDSAGAWHESAGIPRRTKIDYRYDLTRFVGSKGVRSRLPLTQLPVQASRGCTYLCSFCSWISLFGRAGYHVRSAEDFLHDVEHAFDHTGVDRFMVVDNLFGADREATQELLESLVRRFEGRKRQPTFTVLCRADQFTHGEDLFSDSFLQLMRRAGIWNISMGLESVEDATLQDMRKEAETHVYVDTAERLQRFGFKISASFMAGYADDTERSVRSIAPFARNLGCFTIQMYCPAITPRTSDWKQLIHRRIPGHPARFLNGHSVATFPQRILPSVLQKTLFETADDFCRGGQREAQKLIVARIYRRVWNGMKPFYAALAEIEREVLLPERIYRESSPGSWELDEDRLLTLFADRERYEDFARRIEEIFDPVRYPEGVEPLLPMPRDPLPGAGSNLAARRGQRAWSEARGGGGMQ